MVGRGMNNQGLRAQRKLTSGAVEGTQGGVDIFTADLHLLVSPLSVPL